MIVCDQFCKASHGYHRCNDEDYEDLMGVDAFNITNEFDEDYKSSEIFPCEECGEKFDELIKVKEHFLKKHKPYEILECSECDYTIQSVDRLIMHIGVNHYDIVMKRL